MILSPIYKFFKYWYVYVLITQDLLPLALAALSSSSLTSSGESSPSFVMTPAATVLPPSLTANLYPTRIGRG